LINPPGPDIFDGQSLYAPAGGLNNQGNRKMDGQQQQQQHQHQHQTPSIDRIQENGFSNNQQQQQQYSYDSDFYSSVNKVQPIILQENSNPGNDHYNNNYQSQPQKFSPYDQHAKGSKHYSIHQQESPMTNPNRPTSSINLNTINSYTSMGASNNNANLQGSSNGISPYTYSSGMPLWFYGLI
jgi:hypothetical protein